MRTQRDLLRLTLGSERKRSSRGNDAPSALAVISQESEREVLGEAFRAANWDLTMVDSVPAALASLRRSPVPIVLCERSAGWHQAISSFCSLPQRPWIILLSSRSDQNLWEELTALGGSDVLRTPLNMDAVTRSVKSGWLLWRHLRRLQNAVTK